ncbi:hypothetical protein BKI52_28460 [marine bacterium AO1-C]|nr:hypothetical protein BKI52_28460 [marine bacterium AO1-C]
MVYVAAILAVVSFLVPKEMKLSDNQVIRFPQPSDVLPAKKKAYKNISNITDQFDPTKSKGNTNKGSNSGGKGTTADNGSGNDSTGSKVAADSVKKKLQAYTPPDSLRLKPELKIQFPEGQDTVLYPFFRALNTLQNKTAQKVVRVLHYGDSQLEGDRITNFLRGKFQEQFGGGGVGMLDIVDKLHTKTAFYQKASPRWIPSSFFGRTYRRTNSKFYGLLGKYYRFYNPALGYNDGEYNFSEPQPLFRKASYTPKPLKTTRVSASVTYTTLPSATPKQRAVQNVKVLYRSSKGPFDLQIFAKNDSSIRVKIPASDEFNYYEHKFSKPLEMVQVKITGSKSPQIYGVALDANRGIAFDNIPIRGSSGVEFTRIEKEHFREQIRKMNVKFLILQFGVNIVPNVLKNYGWYEKMFYQQLMFLKSLDPDLSILVIGVSDMSRRVAGGYETYPNVPLIRDAQKNAAFKAGCAFWDLYEAMGGKNSMPSWVFNNPKLANLDFTHFTGKGAQIVSEMLYKAILSEYDKFYQLYR